jgi:lon-related putative ATP-dependent protease
LSNTVRQQQNTETPATSLNHIPQGEGMQPAKTLPPEELYRHCDQELFDFNTTAELTDQLQTPGQERAVEAIDFGTEMELGGFNLFVLGPPGTGRHRIVRQILGQKAAQRAAADDWCYVNNFDNPKQPHRLRMPAGQGQVLRRDVAQLVEEAYTAIPAAFESEDYRTRQQAIGEEFNEYQEKIFEEVKQHARERGISIIQTPTGLAFVPMRGDKTISPKEYAKLPKEEQEQLQRDTEAVSKDLQEMMQSIPQEARRVRAKIRELNREVSMFAVGGLIDLLILKYKTLPDVVSYLEDMQTDIVDNVELFLRSSEPEGIASRSPFAGHKHGTETQESMALQRYAVNVIVDHDPEAGAPVVFEDHPTFPELIGRVEHISEMGTLITNFNLIRAGALHRANGGYLILDANKLLVQPFAWEGLKRALKSGEISIKSLGEALSLVSTVALEPDPIPLDVKVILIGDRMLYYLLQAYDPEFLDLFKVAADFEGMIDRTTENSVQFAHLLAAIIRQEQLRPMDRAATARVLEASARHAGDAEKLSAEIRYAADIVREANFYARRNGKQVIGQAEIQQSLDTRERRSSRIRDRLQEEILRGTVLIDTSGEHTGQVNALAVAQLDDFIFAHPSRITARVALGSGEVVDIEREVELGGPIHSKGVLILSGYLAAQYLIDSPLSLFASLVFEQTYGGIEGDSASAAELCALLSALAEAPVRQGLAITGSVNQHGQIQAIGAVNEKIEGFFDICNKRGLSGDQGVLIPAANTPHLMLRKDVIDAVAKQQFHVYPVASIDQCVTLLTGIDAGKRAADGGFPDGTINQRVRSRLQDFADKRHSFGSSDSGTDHAT